MTSCYDQLIAEIRFSYPELSSAEISERIATLVQEEILPEALTKIRLPKLPSPTSVRSEELRARRYGKDRITPLQENVKLIQDLEKLRFEFNGSSLTCDDLFFDLVNGTQSSFVPRARSDVGPYGKPLSVEPDIVRERLKTTTSPEKHERIVERPTSLIDFDSPIQERITNDPLFEKAMGAIESRIRKNYSHETVEIFFNLRARTDRDDPKREKTILHIKVPAYDFDEKMELWEKIEKDIRDVIGELDISETEREAIDRNLFTHVDPS